MSPRRLVIACLVTAGLLLAAAPLLTAPTPASWPPPPTIVPSSNIGPFRLGMTERDVRPLLRTAPCGVTAMYTEGQTSRLETNCGGAYKTAERIQVGEGPTRIFLAYGQPQQRIASDFAGVRGEWISYTREGIAFRIVYGEGLTNALIQAIAVFRGTAPGLVRRIPPAELPPVLPTPTPGIGE